MRKRGRSEAQALLEVFRGPEVYMSGGATFFSTILDRIDRAAVIGATISGFVAQVVPASIEGKSFKVQFFVQKDISRM